MNLAMPTLYILNNSHTRTYSSNHLMNLKTCIIFLPNFSMYWWSNTGHVHFPNPKYCSLLVQVPC